MPFLYNNVFFYEMYTLSLKTQYNLANLINCLSVFLFPTGIRICSMPCVSACTRSGVHAGIITLI